jgi:hypothetical protein
MSFRAVFIAIVLAFGLIVAAFLINRSRPDAGRDSPDFIRATGKCAECHANQHASVVHEYELSVHARKNVNCLDCHQKVTGQQGQDHHGFVIARGLTAANCRGCHEQEYQQFLRSRHAVPSWTAVVGSEGVSADLLRAAEKHHPDHCRRPPNALAALEGPSAIAGGCVKCHSIGKPNADGSVGTCTACHTRHTASVEVARLPTTCGQCHMGPDHSQLEIYNESKHGVLFNAQRSLLKLNASPKGLTTHDMFIPTCATCHMSGLNGLKMTHDTSERLSWNLADAVTKKRPNHDTAQTNMKDVCAKCHTQPVVDRVFKESEKVVDATNRKVVEARDIIEGLKKDRLLSREPFATPLDFKYFDLWHYYGRTAKHGAFMGGADFVQWHGNYPLLTHLVEIRAADRELRKGHDKPK